MPNNKKNNLDLFFEMIDLIEEDISEILDDEKSELGGYECLVICFNNLKLYCVQVGIKFEQLEDHYNEFKKSGANNAIWSFDIGFKPKNCIEVEEFSRILEEIENSLATFEKRCERTQESFDEWNCVFIFYSCLRKYCVERKVNYAELMRDVLKIKSDFEKDINKEQGGVSN